MNYRLKVKIVTTMDSQRPRQKSPIRKIPWPTGSQQDHQASGVNVPADSRHGAQKYPDNYASSPQFSQESSGITPLPTNYHYKDYIIHRKGYQSLSELGIMDTECCYDLPSIAASDQQHSSTEISQAYMLRRKRTQQIYRPRAMKMTGSHTATTSDQTQQQEHTLSRSVHRKLTQMLQAKIATDGTYTEEGLIRLFTTLYFSNATLDRHALIKYIEEMAEAFAVTDPLRIIREKNLAQGLDIFGKSINDTSIQIPKNLSDESISRAADRLLLRTLTRVSNPTQTGTGSRKVPVSLPVLPHSQINKQRNTSPSHNHLNLQTVTDSHRHSSHSASTHQNLSPETTLKVSNLATSTCPPLVQSAKQQQQHPASPVTLQEQFQRILEQQVIQQAQQQAQIQLLQQQLCIQQELQQQQLLEQQMYNERIRNQDYANYLHAHRQVEPFPHLTRLPTASLSIPRSTTVSTSHVAGHMGVFKMPPRKRQTISGHQAITRANISPDRARISDRQQQLLYECRSRAQELADILLSNKAVSDQAAHDTAQLNWNQFSYTKELENNRIYDAPEPPSQLDTQVDMQNSPDPIPVVVVDEFDKAVQNTIQEDLPDTPVLLSKCKPKRVGTPLIYREGITTILSHDDEDTDPNLIHSLESRGRSRLGRRYMVQEADYHQPSVDIGVELEADSVALDSISATCEYLANQRCAGIN